MYRVVRLSGKYLAKEMNGFNIAKQLENDEENIDTFVSEGTPVILVNDLSDLSELDINEEDVELVS